MNGYEKYFYTYKNEYYIPTTNEMYCGYVGITNGIAYIPDTNTKLSPIHTYLSQFDLSHDFFDRLLDEDLELPYSKEQTTFAVNDFLNKSNVRTILQRLQLNNQYLFKCSTISSPKISTTNNAIFYTPWSGGTLTASSVPEKKSKDKTLSENLFSTYNKSADVDLLDIQDAVMFVGGNGTYTTSDETEYEASKIYIVLLFKTKILFVRCLYSKEWSGEDFNINLTNENRYDTITLKTVDPSNKNSLNFVNLVSLTFDDNYLYVVDKGANTLFKYNVSHLFNNEQWNSRSISLIDSVYGSQNQTKVLFKSPTSVATSGDYVFLADDGNHCIKKYTKSLDVIKSIKSGQFHSQEIQAIASNENKFRLYNGTEIGENSIWVISKSTNHFYMTIISNDNIVFQKQIHGIKEDDTYYKENIKSIKFSKSNSNYFFIVSNKRILKVHTSKPHLPFASFYHVNEQTLGTTNVWKLVNSNWINTSIKWGDETTLDISNSNTTLVKCFCLDADDKGNDIMFDIQLYLNEDKVKKYLTSTTFDNLENYQISNCISTPYIALSAQKHEFISLLFSFDFPCYDSTDVQEINYSEYINPLTINKALFKVSYNLIQLKNALKGRFWGFYNTNHIMQYDRTVLDSSFQNISLTDDDRNFFIHENEPSSIIINRVFECIWETQNQILKYLKVVQRSCSTANNNANIPTVIS